MAQYCRQAWNSSRDVRTYLQNAPFHIFTHNTRFGHHPRPLCVCLRCLFFFGILQCFRLGLSLGSSVCFGHHAIPALWLAADSAQDEMKREGWLCSLPLIWEACCLRLPLHFLGHSDVGVGPATFGNGSNTTMRNTHGGKKYRTNQLPDVSFDFDSKHGRFFFVVFLVKILDYCITLHSLESHETVEHLAPKLMMEMISTFYLRFSKQWLNARF